MKIMVAGSRGQLGKELIRQLGAERESGLSVVGVDLDSLDICDESAVFAFCRREEPDIIVNCA
ncbi:MAG TPA: sugar nucleotide-binding protein, partial [Bacillota bacterium]|nr:sugar nucleotide-binding protein [Bacillota bacterium]